MREALNYQARRRAVRLATLVICAAALAVTFAGCNLFGSSSSSSNDTSSALTKIPWCDKPFIQFVDSTSASQTPITNWDAVKGELGFTLYLPPSLPKGTCLVLAGGSIHDAIYGAHVSITWDVPNTGPISLSEAPVRGQGSVALQCTASAQNTQTNVCLGTHNGTSVTIASRQSTADLQTLFKSLQPNLDWVPSDTNQLLATPTATAGS